MLAKKSLKSLGLFIFLASFLWALGSQLLAAAEKMPVYPLTGDWKEPLVLPAGQENLGSKLTKSVEEPAVANWKKATTFYEFKKSLPEPTQEEFVYEVGLFSKKTVRTQHMPKVFEKLCSKKFGGKDYGFREPLDPQENWLRSFGNIMERFKTVRGNPVQTQKLLKQIQTDYPKIWQEIRMVVPQLVQNDFLYSASWDPYKDESAPGKANDGLIFMPYWKMKANPKRSSLWNGDLKEHKVYQGGAFIYASLDKIKSVERDYAKYLNHVGMGYLAAAPLKESYAKGLDSKGNEFIAVEVFVRQDLPFPYDSSKYTYKIFDFYNSKGYYISDYYSDNRSDINWMAGRDTFFEVKNTQGKFVGWLIATELGFDIKNLPERDQDRVVSVRGAWGNIKLISEGFEGVSKVGSGPGKTK